jgi:hypothetical protein
MSTGASRWRMDSGHGSRKPHIHIQGIDSTRLDEEAQRELEKRACHTDVNGKPVIPEEDLERYLADLNHKKKEEDRPDEQ